MDFDNLFDFGVGEREADRVKKLQKVGALSPPRQLHMSYTPACSLTAWPA